jgi:ABC-type molybdenum transport system ATPase subunit/photorepair protein PhrA
MAKAIEIRDATVLLGGAPVLKNVNLSLEEGEHACILGPNGSGKSTIVRLISGALFPLYREPAAVRLYGHDRWELFALRNRLGIVSDCLQAAQAGGERVRETILSGFFGGWGFPASRYRRLDGEKGGGSRPASGRRRTHGPPGVRTLVRTDAPVLVARAWYTIRNLLLTAYTS